MLCHSRGEITADGSLRVCINYLSEWIRTPRMQWIKINVDEERTTWFARVYLYLIFMCVVRAIWLPFVFISLISLATQCDTTACAFNVSRLSKSLKSKRARALASYDDYYVDETGMIIIGFEVWFRGNHATNVCATSRNSIHWTKTQTAGACLFVCENPESHKKKPEGRWWWRDG